MVTRWGLIRDWGIVAGIITAAGLAGLTGVAVANAESGSASSTNPMSSLVKAIASNFNLKEADVQSVFDANRTQME